MKDVKVGDVVMLNSDSPKMTIRRIGDGGVICDYFYGAQYYCNKFMTEELKRVGEK